MEQRQQRKKKIRQRKIDKIMTQALFKFSIRCLRKYMKIKPMSHYAFSPYNLYEALFLVYLISSGVVEQRLKGILFLREVSKVDLIGTVNFDKYFSQFINKASTFCHLQLPTIFETTAFKTTCDYENESMCWIRKRKFSANPEPMKELVKTEFVILDDSSETKANVCKINEKIESQTKMHIHDMVKLNETDDNLKIVLTTVLRFNVRDFEKLTTPESDSSSESVSVGQKCKSFFYDELNILVGEFPYTNSNASLFMLRPASMNPARQIKVSSSNSELYKLIKQLSTDEEIRKLRNLLDNNIKATKIRYTSWPTFELEKNLNIRELLQDLGVEQLFTDAIDLDTFFTRTKQRVRYGNPVHRVRVKVTAEDTVAGAMTLLTGQKSVKNTKLSDVNSKYPFVWLIYDKRQREILFIGACRKSSS